MKGKNTTKVSITFVIRAPDLHTSSPFAGTRFLGCPPGTHPQGAFANKMYLFPALSYNNKE